MNQKRCFDRYSSDDEEELPRKRPYEAHKAVFGEHSPQHGQEVDATEESAYELLDPRSSNDIRKSSLGRCSHVPRQSTQTPPVGVYATPESSQESPKRSNHRIPGEWPICEETPVQANMEHSVGEKKSWPISKISQRDTSVNEGSSQATGHQASPASSQNSTSQPSRQLSLDTCMAGDLHTKRSSFQEPSDIKVPNPLHRGRSISPAVAQDTTPTPSQETSNTSVEASHHKGCRSQVPLEERKHYALYRLCPQKIQFLECRLQHYKDDLPEGRSNDECWLYRGDLLPKPKEGQGTGGVIRLNFSVPLRGRARRISFHYGIVQKLIEGTLSDKDKQLIIEEGSKAQLSHRCLNWTCLNTRHHCVELQTANLYRNECFKLSWCECDPPCLKDLKQPGASLRPTPIPSVDKGEEFK